MRVIILTLICIVLLTSVASAEIILSQTKSLYNLGDQFSIQGTLKVTSKMTDFIQIYLICNNKQTEFYREYLILDAGDEKRIEPNVVLYKDIIGDSSGICRIKATFKGEYVLSDDFEISDKININSTLNKLEFAPEENIVLSGTAVKENGDLVDGFIDVIISRPNNTKMEILDTVNNGLFFINFSMPKDSKSALYPISVKVYERDIYREITNNKIIYYNFLITQVPTTLNIEFENASIEPGTNMKVKAILLDQANDKINSIASITIKNGNEKIINQEDKQTNEYLEFPIVYNEHPAIWTVTASSNKLSAEKRANILEKMDVKTELVNDTIVLTNIGNIPYNKTVSVKINNKTVDFETYLKVDESKIYMVAAPNGEYQVEISSNGKLGFTGNAILTGDSVEIREKTQSVGFIRHPLLWIFIVMIIGAVAFMFIRKEENNFKVSSDSSFNRPKRNNDVMITPRNNNSVPQQRSIQPVQPPVKRSIPISNNSYQPSQFQRVKTIVEPEKEQTVRKINPQNMENFVIDSRIREAIPSSSINGPKQESSIICLKIKNYSAINDNGVKETIQKIISLAEDKKAVLYNNSDYLFFILSPLITRTQENEKTALNIAKSIKDSLESHNKSFRQKIEYGISLNNGEIVATRERDTLKFMGLGNVIILAKKIAAISQNDILLGEAINYKLMSVLKTEKKNKDGVTFYVIREMKQQPSEENKKFINGFVKRYRESRY